MTWLKKAIKSQHEKIRNQMYKQLNSDSYWYFYYHRECPVCGKDNSYKERRYTPKPLNKKDRYEFKQEYDYCVKE